MSTKMIPSVGRTVHYYSSSWDYNGVGAGPYAAIITQVFENPADPASAYCNLTVFLPSGAPLNVGSVPQQGTMHDFGAQHWCQPPRVDAF